MAAMDLYGDLAEAQFGRVDILVNCAGQTKRMPTLEFLESDWNAILETNLNGTLRTCKVFGRHMIEQGGPPGKIVTVSSMSAYTASVNRGDYCLAKAGLVASTSEGRRMIQQGAVELDGNPIVSLDYNVRSSGESHLVKVGKRRFKRFVLEKE